MDMFEVLVGIMGGALGVILFLPQLIKSLRTKSTKDISLWTYALITINAGLWVTYGLFKSDPIIYAPNLIATLLSVVMIILKRRYD